MRGIIRQKRFAQRNGRITAWHPMKLKGSAEREGHSYLLQLESGWISGGLADNPLATNSPLRRREICRR